MDKLLNHPFWTSHALLIARVVVGGFFLFAGVTKITSGIAGTEAYIASVGLPMPMLLAWLGALIEIVTGALIILGKYFRSATLSLAAFIVIISFIFHGPQLWADAPMQQTMFLKNLSIAAGLLFMAAHGVGKTWKLK